MIPWSASILLVWVFDIWNVFNFVDAQATSVQCSSSFNWTLNPLSQNPCLVASYLLSACVTSGVIVPPTTQSQGYDLSTATECACSTVTYSLLSVCALCQGVNPSSWDSYAAVCQQQFLSQFPPPIPAGTVIPPWAYQNITADPAHLFNLTVAQNQANPVTSSTPSSTQSPPPPTSSSSSSSFTPSSTQAPPQQSDQSNLSTTASATEAKNETSFAVALAAGVSVTVLVLGFIAYMYIRYLEKREALRYGGDYAAVSPIFLHHDGGGASAIPLLPRSQSPVSMGHYSATTAPSDYSGDVRYDPPRSYPRS